jgi:hypothetical protein
MGIVNLLIRELGNNIKTRPNCDRCIEDQSCFVCQREFCQCAMSKSLISHHPAWLRTRCRISRKTWLCRSTKYNGNKSRPLCKTFLVDLSQRFHWCVLRNRYDFSNESWRDWAGTENHCHAEDVGRRTKNLPRLYKIGVDFMTQTVKSFSRVVRRWFREYTYVVYMYTHVEPMDNQNHE